MIGGRSTEVPRAVARRRGAPDFSDGWNPILVREMTRTLSSRGFVAALAIAMVGGAATILTALEPVGPDALQRGVETLRLFETYVLWPIAIVVLPFRVYVSVRDETSRDKSEGLRLAGVLPKTVLRGYMAATFVRLAIWLLALSPFLAVAYEFRGTSLSDLWSCVLRTAFTATVLSRVAAQCGRIAARGTTFREAFGIVALVGVGAAFLSVLLASQKSFNDGAIAWGILVLAPLLAGLIVIGLIVVGSIFFPVLHGRALAPLWRELFIFSFDKEPPWEVRFRLMRTAWRRHKLDLQTRSTPGAAPGAEDAR